MTDAADSSIYAQVDGAMQAWRQGDVAQANSFVHLADLSRPVTTASIQAGQSAASSSSAVARITTAVDGLVVITQTCDIRRSSLQRPYIEVCPLVHVDPTIAASAAAGERPNYAAIPALGDSAVADLDRVMTVEKGWLSSATIVSGWNTDQEIRRFQAAVARRYQRFAFPDDFTMSMNRLRDKIISRHGKGTSPEGQLFAVLKQIRVSADPHWSANEIDVKLSFILDSGVLSDIPNDVGDTERFNETLRWLLDGRRSSSDIATRLQSESDLESKNVLWTRLAEAWARTCRPQGGINSIIGEIRDVDEYSISEYWESSQLDLDHLSESYGDQDSPPQSQEIERSDMIHPFPPVPLPRRLWRAVSRPFRGS